MIDSIEILTVIAFGLFGSLGHCIGMCGGFIITYSSSKINPNLSKQTQAFKHLLYNFGRVTSYTILGALFGAFGSLWDATPFLRMIMFGFSGLIMLLMGLSLLGKIRFLNSIEYNVTKQKWYKNLFHKLMFGEQFKSFYFLGMLNGIFPCGLVYAALVWAMATGTILGGATVMLLFGLSTIPALFSFGLFVGFLKQFNFRNLMIKFASITVMLFAFWTLYKAYENFNIYISFSDNSLLSTESNETCH